MLRPTEVDVSGDICVSSRSANAMVLASIRDLTVIDPIGRPLFRMTNSISAGVTASLLGLNGGVNVA